MINDLYGPKRPRILSKSHKRPDDETNLIQMLEYNLGEFIDKIEEISGRATKEYALEKSLEKMKADWEGVEFTLLPYRDTVCCHPIAILTILEFDSRLPLH